MWDLNELKRRMTAAVDVLHKEFSGIRAGRASAEFLAPIKVDSYGSFVPLTQVATISVPEPRMITVQVWDKNLVKAVEKAIRESNLGVNPSIDGAIIRVPMPTLTEQRRQELTKVAAKYSEEARISVRNIRRDGMDLLKKLEKDKEISEDDHHKRSEELQKATDEHIKKIDEALTHKQQEIMHV